MGLFYVEIVLRVVVFWLGGIGLVWIRKGLIWRMDLRV